MHAPFAFLFRYNTILTCHKYLFFITRDYSWIMNEDILLKTNYLSFSRNFQSVRTDFRTRTLLNSTGFRGWLGFRVRSWSGISRRGQTVRTLALLVAAASTGFLTPWPWRCLLAGPSSKDAERDTRRAAAHLALPAPVLICFPSVWPCCLPHVHVYTALCFFPSIRPVSSSWAPIRVRGSASVCRLGVGAGEARPQGTLRSGVGLRLGWAQPGRGPWGVAPNA